MEELQVYAARIRNFERVLCGKKGGDIMRGLKVTSSSGQIQSCFVL